jgi:phage tail sheath protein FI
MYALRNTGASVAFLADCDDTTTWSTQMAFALSEGVYMICAGPAGDSISNAVTTKATAGIDSYGVKVLFGDWVYFLDTVNGVTRLISPQGYIAGELSNLSPQNSTLNKMLYGIVGTQKSASNQVYSGAELQALGQAGIDLITNPVPGGNYFGARFGHNSSSNAVTNGDNYTRMTNYIAYTLNAGMGIYIGQLQSATVRRNAAATLSSFFDGLWNQNMIGNAQGTLPYSVQIDNSNNIPSRVALGYMQADIKVQYLSIIERFIVNVEGGQSVIINRQSTQSV